MQTQCPSSLKETTNTKSCHKTQIKNAKRVKFSRGKNWIKLKPI